MAKKKKTKKYPDGRGKRPSDINELAKWIVEISTESPEVSNSKAKARKSVQSK